MAFINLKIFECFCSLDFIQLVHPKHLLILTALMLGLSPVVLSQASAKEIRGAAPLIPLTSEPQAKLIVDAPLPEQLAKGLIVIQYRTENMHIVPVFGAAALDVSPRIGHLHITLDQASWHWVDASNEPLTVQGLMPGLHQILIELADPTHKVIDRKTVKFIIPDR